MRKSDGRVVPLDVVADHGGGVLHAVIPVGRSAAVIDVQDIAEDDVDGDAVGVGVVNRHGSVLQADGAVGHDHHGFAFDLGVAVGHGDGGFLVQAGEEFGVLVIAVVDDGFVEATEAGAGVRGAIFDAERLDDVNHEIGAAAHVRRHFGRGAGGFRLLGRLLTEGDGRIRGDQSSGARRRASQKSTTIDVFLGFRHRSAASWQTL